MLKKGKVVLLGDEAVGKTSLVRRFVYEDFDDKYIATIGTKVSKQKLYLGGDELVLQIWDVLGQHGFSRVQSACFYGATGAMMVIDLTRPETLWNIVNYWLPLLRKTAGDVPVVFMANKSDLNAAPMLRVLGMDRLARDHGEKTFITSAKTGQNVDTAFTTLGVTMLGDGLRKRQFLRRKHDRHRAASAVEAADIIIDEFCREFGDRVHGMSIVRQQFHLAGVDIRAVNIVGLIRVTRRLGDVETSFMGRGLANRRMEGRMKMLRALMIENRVPQAQRV